MICMITWCIKPNAQKLMGIRQRLADGVWGQDVEELKPNRHQEIHVFRPCISPPMSFLYGHGPYGNSSSFHWGSRKILTSSPTMRETFYPSCSSVLQEFTEFFQQHLAVMITTICYNHVLIILQWRILSTKGHLFLHSFYRKAERRWQIVWIFC